MKKIAITGFVLLCAVATVTAQGFSDKEFKLFHLLQGLWKMETGRGAIYEEWQVNEFQIQKFAVR